MTAHTFECEGTRTIDSELEDADADELRTLFVDAVFDDGELDFDRVRERLRKGKALLGSASVAPTAAKKAPKKKTSRR